MKKLLLVLTILFLASTAHAQCVAEVVDVIQDPVRGSIVVRTQYKLNGTVVGVDALPDASAIGQTRYTEESGTIAEIVVKAKADIEEHCGNLIIRNAVRVNDLNAEKLAIIKALTAPLIDSIKTNAVGYTKTLTEKVIQFKGKEITIEADGTFNIVDIP